MGGSEDLPGTLSEIWKHGLGMATGAELNYAKVAQIPRQFPSYEFRSKRIVGKVKCQQKRVRQSIMSAGCIAAQELCILI